MNVVLTVKDKYGEDITNQLASNADGDEDESSSESETEDEDGEVEYNNLYTNVNLFHLAIIF